jgi:hypothetical protein
MNRTPAIGMIATLAIWLNGPTLAAASSLRFENFPAAAYVEAPSPRVSPGPRNDTPISGPA